MGNLDLLTYGLVNQAKINNTQNTLEVFYRNGNA